MIEKYASIPESYATIGNIERKSSLTRLDQSSYKVGLHTKRSSKDFAVYTQLMTEFKEGGCDTKIFD